MRFVHVTLENWRNFLRADVDLARRTFLVGPNAAGKSNFLDALRFLRDIADPQAGFQRAVHGRGSVSQIRSLHARRYPTVAVDVAIDLNGEGHWRYRLEFTQDNQRIPKVAKEIVEHDGRRILARPDREDVADQSRLTQTHLEQVNANKAFRPVADFFSQVRYLHLVPQLVREPDRSVGHARDPYGGDFLEQLAIMQATHRKTFDSRLRRIRDALLVAVPQMKELVLDRDGRGAPHLKGLYEHWRPNAGWQGEAQFSDGTLRLLGLLWALLDGAAPLLLEEPELSLHAAVIQHLPAMMSRLGRKAGRQLIVSTHSADLLADPGIDASEVLLLQPSREGTQIVVAAGVQEVCTLLAAGHSMADVVLPRTAPRDVRQLTLFGGP